MPKKLTFNRYLRAVCDGEITVTVPPDVMDKICAGVEKQIKEFIRKKSRKVRR